MTYLPRQLANRSLGFPSHRRKMAEREGFEPPEPLRAHLISSQAHSTTLPPLREGSKLRKIDLNDPIPREVKRDASRLTRSRHPAPGGRHPCWLEGEAEKACSTA